MAIVKASYTLRAACAKASARYIENRPGKDGQRAHRTLFNADGTMQRRDVYAMIDQADPGSYFFRFVISPDPGSEDRDRNLPLRELTARTIRSLEDCLQQPLQWAAIIHDDHRPHRHIHALAVVPQRLRVQDFQRMRSAATAAAQEQLRHLDLAKEARAQIQQQNVSLGLELSL